MLIYRMLSLRKICPVLKTVYRKRVNSNEQSPHLCVGMLTPRRARLQSGEVKKLWKNYWTLRQDRQQPAGEEGLCPEPTAAGCVVADALGGRAAAVPQ